MITNKTFRELAIKLLNDKNGICHAGYCALEDVAIDGNFDAKDIFDAVDAVPGRYFLNEDIAEKLLKENV